MENSSEKKYLICEDEDVMKGNKFCFCCSEYCPCCREVSKEEFENYYNENNKI